MDVSDVLMVVDTSADVRRRQMIECAWATVTELNTESHDGQVTDTDGIFTVDVLARGDGCATLLWLFFGDLSRKTSQVRTWKYSEQTERKLETVPVIGTAHSVRGFHRIDE